MKIIITSILVALISTSVATSTVDEEWIDLLPAESLQEWNGDRSQWRLEEGILIGEGLDGGPVARTTFLFHPLVASDFILEAEVRLTGGNSGIQYRSRPGNRGAAIGYQADLDAENIYTGILYEAGGRAILGPRGQITFADAKGGQPIAELDGSQRAAEAHRPGTWTRMKVIALGTYLRHEIEGIATCEVYDRSPTAAQRGQFAVQLHQGDPMKIEVRKLRVRLLETEGEHPTPDRERTAADRAKLAAHPPRHPHFPVSKDGARPRWIWSNDPAVAQQKVTLGTTLDLVKPVRAIGGLVTADNRFLLSIDGEPVASGEDWAVPVEFEEKRRLTDKIELSAVVENDEGPAGFALRLTIEYEDGTLCTVVTDADWSALREGIWGPVHDFGIVGRETEPWGDVFARPIASTPSDWRLAPGFRAELLYSAGRGEGSWASMVFERPGQIILSPQAGELLRVKLPASASDSVVTEPIAEGIGNAQGLCFADGALFVHVTDLPQSGGGLWRLEDQNEDGFYESKQQLRSYGVRNEHGSHGLVYGKDGWLYLTIGNHVPLSEELSPTDPYRNFAEDTLLPRLEDPNGHAIGMRAPAGQIVRVRPDGTGWERVAGGLRNAYDLAFHLEDELFTYDSDMEWDLGTPWYRAPRIFHLTSGAEIGWRSGNGKWPDAIPDAVPAVVETDLSSPTGVASGLESRFPGRWRHALFVGDWAYGRILAIHLQEKGASWVGSVEEFCQGSPLNVTDFSFGPDGALYLITGGRGTQSGLYRISVADLALAAEGAPSNPITERGQAARSERRSLEALHRAPHLDRLEEVWRALGAEDRAIRDAARIALEGVPVEHWRQRIRIESESREDPDRLRMALLALVRIGDSDDRESVAEQLLLLPRPNDSASEITELRIAIIALARTSLVPSTMRTALLMRFDPRFPASDFARNRLSTELLAQLEAPLLIERTLQVWKQTPDLSSRLHFASILRHLKSNWNSETREQAGQLLAELKSEGGGHSLNGYITQIKSELQTQIGTTPSIDSTPTNATVTLPKRVSEWTENQLIALARKSPSTDDVVIARAAYKKALCVNCHRRDGLGGGIGTDLTGSAGRYSAEDLVKAIFDPSRDISSQYQWTEVETSDDLFIGRLIGEDDKHLQINPNAFSYERISIHKGSVVRRSPSPVSPMPPGLLDTLNEKEVGALLRWLRETAPLD